MSELRLCPFCGGEAQIQHDRQCGVCRVICFGDTCNVVPATFEVEKESEAVRFWNTRTIDLKPLEELYERWKASPFGHELGKVIRQMKEG